MNHCLAAQMLQGRTDAACNPEHIDMPQDPATRKGILKQGLGQAATAQVHPSTLGVVGVLKPKTATMFFCYSSRGSVAWASISSLCLEPLGASRL